MNLNQFIITIYFWFWIAVGNLVAFVVIIFGILFGKSQEWARKMVRVLVAEFATDMMKLAGFWTVEFQDNRTEANMNRTPVIVVSNHRSLIDTAFTVMLPYDIIYTWKKKWSYVPIFGWMCLLSGHITIDPKSTLSKRNAVRQSENYIRQKKNILFYAEGTRNKNPNITLMPFKTGAFRVAKSTGTPILPITLINTRQGCRDGICDRANIKIIIDDPIEIENISDGIIDVRLKMSEHLRRYDKNYEKLMNGR